MDLDQRITKEFAGKYGYLPGQAKQLSSFVKTVHHFSQYLNANKYYNNELNKRVAVLMLDADILALKVEKVRMLADSFYSQVELSLLTKKKAGLDKQKVEKFKKEMDLLTQEAVENYEAVLRLMRDIRNEYAQRGVE